MRLLLIEGPPGSGKTTTAEELCRCLTEAGVDANWYLEEAVDHPVHPELIVEGRNNSEFPALCLEQWRRFVEGVQEQDLLHIMEGSAFQMTVRFMMHNNHSNMTEYFVKFSEIVTSLEPGFIYLRPNDAQQNSRFITKLRGEHWAEKVSKGETSTPFAIRNGLLGLEGMHKFWQNYAELCDSLFELWKLPKKQILFEHSDYSNHVEESMGFVTKFCGASKCD